MGGDDATVLLVEDEEALLTIYSRWLSPQFDVKTASRGSEALERLDETVDVVLLDRLMPEMTGDEVLSGIQSRASDCRVAMVTAVEPDFDILEMGFDAYLSKPVKSDQIRDTVENLLERSEYDSLLQEYYSLVEKQATLEATKTSVELEDSDEYDDLTARIDDLRDELSEMLGGIEDDDDFIVTVRELTDAENS